MPHFPPRHPRPPRAFATIYTLILMVTLTAFCSLGVDYGRAQLVKTQLRRTADAAARAAASTLNSGTTAARASAISIAAANDADGSPVTLLSTDVEFGSWNATSKSFTPLPAGSTAAPTAVRITAARTAARGNAVPMLFAKLIGKSSCDVSATAVISTQTPSQGYGVAGLNSVVMTGNSLLDSYKSTAGYSASSAGNKGSVVSNGNITLSGNATIKGNASPGPGKQVLVTGGSTTITGNTNPLTAALNYPAPSAGAYATTNDNGKLGGSYLQSNGDFTVPGNQTVNVFAGTYYVKDFYMSASSDLNIKGNVTFYVSGNFYFGGNASTNQNLPTNFKIRMVTPGTTATLNGTSDLYADFYAPTSTVTVSSNSDLYGAVVAGNLTLSGNGGLHYDESLPSPIATTQGAISLVQ